MSGTAQSKQEVVLNVCGDCDRDYSGSFMLYKDSFRKYSVESHGEGGKLTARMEFTTFDCRSRGCDGAVVVSRKALPVS